MRTQWRVGLAGRTGLDYSAIEPVLRLMRIEPGPQIFADLRAMERAALDAMNKAENRG